MSKMAKHSARIHLAFVSPNVRALNWLLYTLVLFGFVHGLANPPETRAEDFKPAILIHVRRPDLQLERLLHLFEGSPFSNPPAALAAWKSKQQVTNSVSWGKPVEALIAALNPQMVGELRLLDKAEVRLGFQANSGNLRWNVKIPEDDGAFSALATAVSLTEGGFEPELDHLQVQRLGAPGSPIVGRAPNALILASSRSDLRPSTSPVELTLPEASTIDSGWLWALDPKEVRISQDFRIRRIAEILLGLGIVRVQGELTLQRDECRLQTRSRLADDPSSPPSSIDPAWFDLIPKANHAVVFAVALADSPAYRNALFEVVDRLEKVDPSHVQTASFRSRIYLMLSASGLNAESELWPKIRGVSGFLAVDQSSGPECGALAIHTSDEKLAEKLVRTFGPRVAELNAPFQPDEQRRSIGLNTGLQRLAQLGSPIHLTQADKSVIVSWGESSEKQTSQARQDPGFSAGPEIRRHFGHALGSLDRAA
jgi:hypothetical protein